jgi:hypothetical protein
VAGNHNIARVALKALADYIVAYVPQLDMVHVGHADPEDLDGTPCASLIPSRTMFDAHLGVDEIEDAATGASLLDVGVWEGTVELRVSGKNQPQREQLETAITNLFMSRARRGTLVVTTPQLIVNNILTVYQAPVAFSLMGSNWEEEAVWEKKRYSYITLQFSYPALIAELADTIEAYHVAFTEDLTSVTPVYESLATDDAGTVTPQP